MPPRFGPKPQDDDGQLGIASDYEKVSSFNPYGKKFVRKHLVEAGFPNPFWAVKGKSDKDLMGMAAKNIVDKFKKSQADAKKKVTPAPVVTPAKPKVAPKARKPVVLRKVVTPKRVVAKKVPAKKAPVKRAPVKKVIKKGPPPQPKYNPLPKAPIKKIAPKPAPKKPVIRRRPGGKIAL